MFRLICVYSTSCAINGNILYIFRGFILIFEYIKRYGNHEEVVFVQDHAVNLKAIIAVHSTKLGPSLGGCRMWPYASEEDALKDVLKLSRGMTYKAAVAGLELGGGKSVIIGDPKNKTPELFHSYGRFIESLGGLYIAAEDVGTSVEDMKHIRQETKYVTGLARESGGSGDPSPYTAKSTLTGMKAAVWHKLKKKSLEGLRVSVQGTGHVGVYLAELLLKEGCEVIICDIFEKKAMDFKKKYPEVKVVNYEKIYDEKCDIFSPCALGSSVTSEILERLDCQIIAGAANNQLHTLKTEEEVRKKNILYCPDFIINAGGLINVFVESKGDYSEKEVIKRIDNIYDILLEIFFLSEMKQKSPTSVAIEIADKRIERSSQNSYRIHL